MTATLDIHPIRSVPIYYGLALLRLSSTKSTCDLTVPVWYVEELHGAVSRNDAKELQPVKSTVNEMVAEPLAGMSPSSRLPEVVTEGLHGLP